MLQTLPIGKNPKDYFERVSRVTGGKCESFDPNSPKATEHLTDFISESILSNLSSNEAVCRRLIESYKKTYKA